MPQPSSDLSNTLRTKSLSAPFSPENSLISEDNIVFPTTVRYEKQLLRPEQNLKWFLDVELRPRRLNALRKFMWLAALPVAGRSLTRQKVMKRTIIATDRIDEHLVWHRDRIFVKPLPDFLLCHEFWKRCLCQDVELHRGACGLLLSYIWLIGSSSDFRIAEDAALLPEGIAFRDFASFSRDFLSHIDLGTLAEVDQRYHYGELRLSRLDRIVRFAPTRLWSCRNFVNGFMNRSTWREAYFKENFGWLLAAFAFFSITLSALQVGLATQKLGSSRNFEEISYGLTIAGVSAVLASVVVILMVWFSLFWFHLLSTRWFMTRVESQRDRNMSSKG